ncbi:MAG: TrkA family potassium uptake protein [Candidatus Omnitrophica bacterium]|nr:TrkA family potassium uptake protein [Candidatus Omnitrophota bacterium]
MKQIVVIGLGNFGYTLATSLAEGKCEVLALDRDRERIQQIKDFVTRAVVADAADKDALAELGINDADVAIVSLGDRIDVSILVTLFLKELGVKRILAKAVSDDHGKVLRLVGANEIIFPEKDEAVKLAASLIVPDILEYIRLSEDYSVVEIAAPEKFYSKSLKELQFRTKYGIEVLAIRRPLEGTLNIIPSPDYKIQPDDCLVLIGENKNIEKFRG